MLTACHAAAPRVRRLRLRADASSSAAAPASLAPPLASVPSRPLSAGVAPLLTSEQGAYLTDASCSPLTLKRVSLFTGVYAVYSPDGVLQYVGISRKARTSTAAAKLSHVASVSVQMSASIGLHLAELPALCGSAKLHALPGVTREALQAAWQAWVEEAVAASGVPPPGNLGASPWVARKAKPAKRELRLTAGKGLDDISVPLSELIKSVVTTCGVVAFIKGTRATPECGFSQRLVDALATTGVEFEVCNVLDTVYNPGLREALKEFSAWPTIPQLYANGEFIGGSDIVAELAASGELASRLAKR